MPSQRHVPDDAFARLVARYQHRVRGYLARRLPVDAVDDVLAEVLLVAWRRREEMPADPLPWLLGVSAKTVATRWRAEARRDALLERVARQPLPTSPSIDADVRRREQQRALAEALAALEDRDRELLVLRYWDDLSPRQIAAAMSLPSVTVRARLRRATARLHRRLRAALAEPAPSEVGVDGADDSPDPLAVPAR